MTNPTLKDRLAAADTAISDKVADRVLADIAKMPVDRQDVLECMERTGGGFVSHLARAWMRADDNNAAKLLAAFADYYAQYEQFAIVEAARREKARSQVTA